MVFRCVRRVAGRRVGCGGVAPCGAVANPATVQECRESRGQKVTLECRIGGREKIVTTSSEEDLHAAVMDVRDDLRRRLNDAKTRQEPRHNRHLRDIAQPETGDLAQ